MQIVHYLYALKTQVKLAESNSNTAMLPQLTDEAKVLVEISKIISKPASNFFKELIEAGKNNSAKPL
jgi:hypothetical protein